MKIGLFFGSFNPMHMGHLMVADYCQVNTDLDEVWIVITPQSPFKQKSNLLDDTQRLKMVELAIEDYPKLKSSDIEFDLPQPNYTFRTLQLLNEKFPDYSFSILMGEDNLQGLHKWKEADYILENYRILVYPRIHKKKGKPLSKKYDIQKVKAPIVELSSTQIRKAIKDERLVVSMLPKYVAEYIHSHNLYR